MTLEIASGTEPVRFAGGSGVESRWKLGVSRVGSLIQLTVGKVQWRCTETAPEIRSESPIRLHFNCTGTAPGAPVEHATRKQKINQQFNS